MRLALPPPGKSFRSTVDVVGEIESVFRIFILHMGLSALGRKFGDVAQVSNRFPTCRIADFQSAGAAWLGTLKRWGPAGWKPCDTDVKAIVRSSPQRG